MGHESKKFDLGGLSIDQFGVAVMEIKVFVLLCFDISMFKYNFIRNSCLLFRVRLVMILIELELLIGPIQEFNKYTRRKFSVESSFILYS